MATRKLNVFEKLANIFGTLYRQQANQFPRRSAILKSVWHKELKPPTTADLPAIKAEFKRVLNVIETGAYRQLTVREAAVYGAVFLEVLRPFLLKVQVLFWFFVGEVIGRRHLFGYLVPADYVSKDTRRQVKQLNNH